MSEDGAFSIVIIALLGSPFSPAYARERSSGGPARALDFCAMNVAVYGPRGKLWALRERSVADHDREARGLAIGRSTMRWVGDTLVVDLDERTSPFAGVPGRSLRGRVSFHPEARGRAEVPLDHDALHTWWPVAPMGTIDVELTDPDLRFTGHGYHDANAGDVALEDSFASWSWCRARIDRHRTAITYDVTDRRGGERCVALELDAREAEPEVHVVPTATEQALPRTRWRLARSARTEGPRPKVHRELEDTPFYARTLVETRLGGARVIAMHETMSLDRLAQSWVRFLLGFRMGRP